MKWRNSKERELIAHGGSREQTLPTKHNPNPDLSDPVSSPPTASITAPASTGPSIPGDESSSSAAAAAAAVAAASYLKQLPPHLQQQHQPRLPWPPAVDSPASPLVAAATPPFMSAAERMRLVAMQATEGAAAAAARGKGEDFEAEQEADEEDEEEENGVGSSDCEGRAEDDDDDEDEMEEIHVT